MVAFKPLLAPNDDPMRNPDFFSFIKYPCLASPKFDGIRMTNLHKSLWSRTNKPLPNIFIQEKFKEFLHHDGELIAGNPTDHDVYNRTQSIVMSNEKEIDTNEDSRIRLYVFDDLLHLDKPYEQRLEAAAMRVADHGHPDIVHVGHELITCYEELIAYEDVMLEAGFEGIMIRDPLAMYKCGRGTMKQGIIFKLKRFQDDEGIVVDFIEGQKNNNAAFINETGNTARSSSKEGKVAADTLGKFIVDFKGEIIEVAPGVLKHDARKKIWDNKEAYLGQYLKFRHFPKGAKDKPRFPRFVGWRDKMDMGEL